MVEAKIVKNDLTNEQVQRYVELAIANGINAVITISNQFVAKADHSPVNIPKTLLRKVDLYHWSWPWLATACEILTYQETVQDAEQSHLLGQLNHFFAHPATGVERFTQMAPTWKDVAQAVSNDEVLKKTAPEVEEAVASWIAEERDLCLHMSSHVGREVSARLERKFAEDPIARLKDQIEKLVNNQALYTGIRVPDCASDIEVCADIARRTVSAAMIIKAPADRKSIKARINWHLRMLPDDDERTRVRAHWPVRAAPTTKELRVLRTDPTAIQTENPDAAPHTFEIFIVESPGKRFSVARPSLRISSA